MRAATPTASVAVTDPPVRGPARELAERLRQAPAALLTVRERKDAACVARGMSNPQIAAALVVSEPTAQNQVQHILTKLGFSRRSQIGVSAVQNLRS